MCVCVCDRATHCWSPCLTRHTSAVILQCLGLSPQHPARAPRHHKELARLCDGYELQFLARCFGGWLGHERIAVRGQAPKLRRPHAPSLRLWHSSYRCDQRCDPTDLARNAVRHAAGQVSCPPSTTSTSNTSGRSRPSSSTRTRRLRRSALWADCLRSSRSHD